MLTRHMKIQHLLGLTAAVLEIGLLTVAAQVETTTPGRLRFEAQVSRADLQTVNSVQVSADGRFVYATPWQTGAVVVFRREIPGGALAHVQTLGEVGLLAGDTGIALSPATDHALAACFIAKTAVLLGRDSKTGELDVLDSARQGRNKVTGLDFAIDAIFSPDGRYVYVLDGGEGGITTFGVREDKLEWLQSTQGENKCLAGSRGVALDPTGHIMYVASSNAGTLTALERNPKTGLLKLLQVVRDEEEDVHGLAGAFGVVCSGDGQFIYTTAGRFSGDSAVSVFRRDAAGKVQVVQELIAERGEIPSFLGGNRLLLSPDGKNLYAVASRSGSVACFQRNSKSGRLRHFETLTAGDAKGIVDGAAGIAITPDGQYVYVAAEGKHSISIYRRE